MDLNRINKIFSLYEKYGDNNYIGERVSQIEHALQCSFLAEKENFPNHVILAAFLHDIGHLLEFNKEIQQPMMIYNNINYGPMNHEKLGADYLRLNEVPEMICHLVENHVTAKRYLVYKDNAYYEKLSEASKQTLVYQGGQMNQKEADHFEKSETFQLVLKMRDWDDKAKNTQTKLALQANELLAKLKNMLSKLCSIEYEDTNKQF